MQARAQEVADADAAAKMQEAERTMQCMQLSVSIQMRIYFHLYMRLSILN